MAIAKLRRELAQMDEASSVEAVFTLNLPKTERPEQVEARVNSMVAKAASSSRAKVERVSIKARIHTFAVKGPVALVDRLAHDPLVYGGMLNVSQKDLLIRGTVKPLAKKVMSSKRTSVKLSPFGALATQSKSRKSLALGQRDLEVLSITARSNGSKTKAGAEI